MTGDAVDPDWLNDTPLPNFNPTGLRMRMDKISRRLSLKGPVFNMIHRRNSLHRNSLRVVTSPMSWGAFSYGGKPKCRRRGGFCPECCISVVVFIYLPYFPEKARELTAAGMCANGSHNIGQR